MKTKIAEALKTKYKSFGLSNEAWDRIASAKKETVTKEEDIEAGISDFATMDLIAKELQKMRDGEIQKRTDLQRQHDDYVATHPDNPGGGDGGQGGTNDDKNKQTPLTAEAIADLIKNATAEAVKDVKDEFDAYKAQNSAKEAIVLGKSTFFGNKWTEKFKDEAEDAWERVTELNEAKGGNMSAEDLSNKATEFFNKAVQRKGVDASKPFEASGQQNGNFDFSSQVEHLKGKGLIPKEEK